jgi:hypothetical protein
MAGQTIEEREINRFNRQLIAAQKAAPLPPDLKDLNPNLEKTLTFNKDGMPIGVKGKWEYSSYRKGGLFTSERSEGWKWIWNKSSADEFEVYPINITDGTQPMRALFVFGDTDKAYISVKDTLLVNHNLYTYNGSTWTSMELQKPEQELRSAAVRELDEHMKTKRNMQQKIVTEKAAEETAKQERGYFEKQPVYKAGAPLTMYDTRIADYYNYLYHGPIHDDEYKYSPDAITNSEEDLIMLADDADHMYIENQGKWEKIQLRPEHENLKRIAPTKAMRQISAHVRALSIKYTAALQESQRHFSAEDTRVDNNHMRNLVIQYVLNNFPPVNTPGSTYLTPPSNKSISVAATTIPLPVALAGTAPPAEDPIAFGGYRRTRKHKRRASSKSKAMRYTSRKARRVHRH